MENQTKQQMIEQAKKSLALFETKINNGDEINCDGWLAEFERQKRILARCGVSETDAVMIELSDKITVLSPRQLGADDARRAVADAATEVLGGRDAMLISLMELEHIADTHRGPVCDYLNGVIFARSSLVAAGVEIA